MRCCCAATKMLRPKEFLWAGWADDQFKRAWDGLARFETHPDVLTRPLDIVQIGIVCVLGYLDFRFPDCGWRKTFPKLDAFHEKMMQREFGADHPFRRRPEPKGRTMSDRADETDFKAWHAVADLYHAYFTGLIMSAVTRRNSADAAEFVFRVFRRQHHERFLAGIEKFGLTKAPHAVAAAQYHYLSNQIGGVNVEYHARVRPQGVDPLSAAALGLARHRDLRDSRRGIGGDAARLARPKRRLVQNPRMGFVCTKQTVDGQNGLEGFYYEYDRDLAPDERLVFARHLEAPLFDPAAAPKLASDTWPRSRAGKSLSQLCDGICPRSALPVIVNLFGPHDAGHLLHLTGRLIGMQFYPDIAVSFPAAHDQRPTRLWQRFCSRCCSRRATTPI